jgi:hypothetical protein
MMIIFVGKSPKRLAEDGTIRKITMRNFVVKINLSVFTTNNKLSSLIIA